MKDINWRQKLSSRKFWAAVIGVFGAVAVLLGASDELITQVSAILSASGVLIAYIFGESMIDAASVSSAGEKNTDTESEDN